MSLTPPSHSLFHRRRSLRLSQPNSPPPGREVQRRGVDNPLSFTPLAVFSLHTSDVVGVRTRSSSGNRPRFLLICGSRSRLWLWWLLGVGGGTVIEVLARSADSSGNRPREHSVFFCYRMRWCIGVHWFFCCGFW